MRDGLQLEAPVPLEAKLEMLEALVATGVRRIEATSFVSPKAVPALADADQVAAELSRWPGVHWSALVANPRGAVRAVDAGDRPPGVRGLGRRRRTAAPTPAAPRPRRSPPSARSPGWPTAPAARSRSSSPRPGTAPSTAARPIARTVDVARAAVTAGADQLCLGDTIGTTTPLRVVQLLDAVRRACPGVPLGVHFHDTRGTGQANALAAVQAGVTQLDSSVGGLGGCPFAPGASGNIATEELVYMLEESGVRTGLDLDAVLAAARVTEQAVGHELPSSLYRAGGRSVPRGPVAGRDRRGADGRAPRAIVDPRVMRDVLGHFASGVTVVTAVTEDGPIGFTCQSFSSLSLDPPLVAFAPARTSRTWPRLREIGRFCVNVLAEGQDDVSQKFARSGARQVRRGALDAEPARLTGPRRRRRLDRRRAVGRVRRRRPHDRRRPRPGPRRAPRPASAAVPPRRSYGLLRTEAEG